MTFKNGFTFEFYCKLNKWFSEPYPNSYPSKGIGFFCRTINLMSGYWRTMRFGVQENGWLGDFSDVASWIGEGYRLHTFSDGDFGVIDLGDLGFAEGDEFYLTIVYSNDDEYNESRDAFMRDNKNIDRIDYYLNGILVGYTYYGKESYAAGLTYWDNDNYPFFIGATYYGALGAIYYFKGDCYTTRLYYNSLTPEQVKLNYDMTLKYRDSFKNE